MIDLEVCLQLALQAHITLPQMFQFPKDELERALEGTVNTSHFREVVDLLEKARIETPERLAVMYNQLKLKKEFKNDMPSAWYRVGATIQIPLDMAADIVEHNDADYTTGVIHRYLKENPHVIRFDGEAYSPEDCIYIEGYAQKSEEHGGGCL